MKHVNDTGCAGGSRHNVEEEVSPDVAECDAAPRLPHSVITHPSVHTDTTQGMRGPQRAGLFDILSLPLVVAVMCCAQRWVSGGSKPGHK